MFSCGDGTWPPGAPHNPGGFSVPLIPLLLAGICLVDGVYLAAALGSGIWLLAGAFGMSLTLLGQKFVRGD